MSGLSIAAPFDRARLAAVADALMVAVAVALPWSTSAVGILLVLWLLALIPTLDWPQVRRELLTAAGGLPVLLCALGVIGMAWADVSWAARWGGLNSFFRLLAIPLLIVQFRRSENCIALLIASWAVAIWRDLPKGSTDFGVAVKSYIVQSVEFAICAAGLLYLAVEAAQARRWIRFAVLFVIALAFLQDIFFVATGRTTLVIIPALVVVYGAQRFGRKGFVAAAIVAVVLAAGVWVSSHYVRLRVDKIFTATDRDVPARGSRTFRARGGSVDQPAQSDLRSRHSARLAWHRGAVGDVACPFLPVPRRRPGGVDRCGHGHPECCRLAV
ncbi:MAG: hypothetical protein P8Y71_26215 [Pseudolabrys sp.]